MMTGLHFLAEMHTLHCIPPVPLFLINHLKTALFIDFMGTYNALQQLAEIRKMAILLIQRQN